MRSVRPPSSRMSIDCAHSKESWRAILPCSIRCGQRASVWCFPSVVCLIDHAVRNWRGKACAVRRGAIDHPFTPSPCAPILASGGCGVRTGKLIPATLHSRQGTGRTAWTVVQVTGAHLACWVDGNIKTCTALAVALPLIWRIPHLWSNSTNTPYANRHMSCAIS